MTAININSSWKEVEWWQDDTNNANQKVRWRLIARCEEDVEDNSSDVYFWVQKRITNGDQGWAEYPTYKDMEVACTGADSDTHRATMSWTFGRCESTTWADADGDYHDAYWSNVKHNADGTLTVRAYIEGDRVTSSSDIDTYVDLTLPRIPRASTATVATNPLTIGGTQVISTNRASSSFTHTVAISMGDYSVTYTGVGASVSWITDAATLMPYMSSWQQTVTIRTTTYNGSTNLGTTTTTFKLQVDTSVYKPVITFGSPTDSNATTSALESSGKFIKGYAQLSQLVSVASNDTTYGDKVARLQVTLGSTTQTVVINASSGSMTFTATVTTQTVTAVAVDNRGYSVTKTYTLDVFDYQPITISSVEVERVNANGDPTETGVYLAYTIKGKVFQGNFGQASNTVTVKTASKSASASSYDPDVTEQTVTPSGSGYADYTITGITVGTYSSSSQFDVIFKLSDALTSAESIAVRVHEGVPVAAWGSDHFDVYGEFHIHDREDVSQYVTFSSSDSLAMHNYSWSGSWSNSNSASRTIQITGKGLVIINCYVRNDGTDDTGQCDATIYLWNTSNANQGLLAASANRVSASSSLQISANASTQYYYDGSSANRRLRCNVSCTKNGTNSWRIQATTIGCTLAVL